MCNITELFVFVYVYCMSMALLSSYQKEESWQQIIQNTDKRQLATTDPNISAYKINGGRSAATLNS